MTAGIPGEDRALRKVQLIDQISQDAYDPAEFHDEEKARMLQEADLGRTIRFIAEQPAHVCINELVISPVWNRIYVGGGELNKR